MKYLYFPLIFLIVSCGGGGGGGGRNGGTPFVGANGGSGVVIIRYQT